MKKIPVLAGILLIAVMLGSVGLAAADVVYYPELLVPEKTRGLIWYFSTDVDADGVADFSGRDVVRCSVVANVALDYDGDGLIDEIVEADPLLILRTRKYVVLFFLPRGLPAEGDALATYVSGALKNGEEFLASGPGYAYRWG